MGGGVFCLGNPDRRGGLVFQEIQVRGGLKKKSVEWYKISNALN